MAKLAQDGSQEARSYAKATLVMFMEGHPDWERVLKKNLTQNTMRNMDKILEALRNSNNGNGRSGFKRQASRRGASRKTL